MKPAASGQKYVGKNILFAVTPDAISLDKLLLD